MALHILTCHKSTRSASTPVLATGKAFLSSPTRHLGNKQNGFDRPDSHVTLWFNHKPTSFDPTKYRRCSSDSGAPQPAWAARTSRVEVAIIDTVSPSNNHKSGTSTKGNNRGRKQRGKNTNSTNNNHNNCRHQRLAPHPDHPRWRPLLPRPQTKTRPLEVHFDVFYRTDTSTPVPLGGSLGLHVPTAFLTLAGVRFHLDHRPKPAHSKVDFDVFYRAETPTTPTTTTAAATNALPAPRPPGLASASTSTRPRPAHSTFSTDTSIALVWSPSAGLLGITPGNTRHACPTPIQA
ncbi:hypothetical protein B0T20DRAFT_467619 [Sordaria brevicollis]|uniref:Uncharacterized protein n=1 Tax=Sordaria brevicollis TaxID=83679 RepID=A0AAE0UE90_SORBR|nr:hypothetical protein B0T20DRAFT_467619 [Sordaria brevicollis]